MKRLIPTPSMVVALVALLVALSGSAYAVSQVGTKQIRNGAVTTAKLRNRAVSTPKLRNGSVTAAKIAPGAIARGDAIAVPASDPIGSLDAAFTVMIAQKLQARAGQTLMGSADINLQQFFSGEADVLCQLWATPPGGGSETPMGPLFVARFGVAGEYDLLSISSSLDVTSSGEWTVSLKCRRSSGTAAILVGAKSLQVLAVRP